MNLFDGLLLCGPTLTKFGYCLAQLCFQSNGIAAVLLSGRGANRAGRAIRAGLAGRRCWYLPRRCAGQLTGSTPKVGSRGATDIAIISVSGSESTMFDCGGKERGLSVKGTGGFNSVSGEESSSSLFTILFSVFPDSRNGRSSFVDGRFVIAAWS